MTQHHYLEIERFQAHRPDGRVLLIERTQTFKFSRNLRRAISIWLIPIVSMLLVLIGPSLSPLMIFGPWSFIPGFVLIICGTAIAQDELLRWMRRFAPEPDKCEVIGMDCSTDELVEFYQDISIPDPAQGSIH